MDGHRRDFLKIGAAGVAAASVAPLSGLREARAAAADYEFEMPRNMTLLNMRTGNGYRLGVKTERGILDVSAAAEMYGVPAPADMDDLLQNGKGGMLGTIIQVAADGPADIYLDEATIDYAPLVTRPEKILMMGFNYGLHALEVGVELPPAPTLFNKFNNTLNHHGGTIKLPTHAATNFDYEVELVMVFGRECYNVTEDEALDYVAGYATGNDFSARDLQNLTSQFMIGKTADGFAPIGPYLVTSDLVPDPNNLRLETRVNGEQRQDSNTNDMLFNCRQLISFASKTITIKPGDIFFTGTPPGVIFGMPPERQVWLKPGDEVACSLEGLGELRFSLT
jgi:2-keto-4-pentenoate hydratase/2-oxohepta-3-ene-1,7-dioic acid hydratase in catechol pathway